MKGNLSELLLIPNNQVVGLLSEIKRISYSLVLPFFIFALIWEMFSEYNIGGVIKKLVFALLAISAYPTFHKTVVDLSLQNADTFIKHASPRNFFLRSWYESKIVANTSGKSGVLEKLIIPNLNDLMACALFVFSKISFWLLKLIYSSIYYLTFIFCPLAAILPFLPFFHGAFVGMFRSTLWCCFFPFVVSTLLVVAGNTMDEKVMRNELLVTDMDALMWICGVSFLLLLAPLLTQTILGSEGMASLGSKLVSPQARLMAGWEFIRKKVTQAGRN